MEVDQRSQGLRTTIAPYLGPWFVQSLGKPRHARNVERKVDELLCEHLIKHYNKISFYCVPGKVDVLPYLWHDFSYRLTYTYLLELQEAWVDGLNMARRQDLRYASRAGVTVEVSDSVNEIIELAVRSVEHSGDRFAYEHSEIQRVAAGLAASGAISCLVAREPCGRATAGILLVHGMGVTYCLLGGCDRQHMSRGSHVLAMYAGIERARLSGHRWFDFYGSELSGVEQYFRSFGGKLTPCLKLYRRPHVGNLGDERAPYRATLRSS
jgi:hypothetical protein